MTLFSAYSILWSSLLVLWSSQVETEPNNPDVCLPDEKFLDLDPYSEQGDYIGEEAVTDKFLCLLYPKNILNCSWSFTTLQNDAQVFVYISTCDDTRTVHSLSHSAQKVGSASLILHEHDTLYVILQFNITLHDKWTLYTYTYDLGMLVYTVVISGGDGWRCNPFSCPAQLRVREVLSPPKNLSAFVKDGDLLITWSPPYSQVTSNSKCLEYQLVMDDQERPMNYTGQLSTQLRNADPSRNYRVRIRTRKATSCAHDSQWSDWSDPVTVKASKYRLNTLVITSISLGIPMILLAVLLLVRNQRVSMVLFPPIPCPPPKYIHFLQKNDTFNVFHQAPSAEPVEEITEVEDTEPDPGNAF